MTENINESRLAFAEILTVLLSGIAGIWWGVRMGDGIMYITGVDLRPFLCGLMIAGLLFHGYSNFKSNRKYSALYRVLLWISGILISLLIYSLIVMVLGDIVIFLVRLILGIHNAAGSGGTFHLLFYGASPDLFTSGRHSVWGSRIWNYENTALLGLVLSIIVTIYGVVHARQFIVRSYTVPLKDCTAPCRIVQLSDLHMGSVVNASYVRRILRKTAELRPDYVVLTGDIFNHGYVEEAGHLPHIEKDFRELNSAIVHAESDRSAADYSLNNKTFPEESGVSSGESSEGSSTSRPTSRIFAVVGNHDPQPDDVAFRQFLQKSDITLLHDRTVSLPEIYLSGRGGSHVNHRPALNSWLSSTHTGRPLVLLDHYPDGIHEAEEANVDLMLSGHTHGGQYFPCNLLIMKHYAHGLMHGRSQWGKTTSIVSWGAGFFQIPIRVGTSSEIVCVDIIPPHAQ